MKVISGTKTVFFDIDNTLVFSIEEFSHLFSETVVEINDRKFWVHKLHVEMIKDFKARGHTIIVWSAGGSEWAATVILSLKLSAYVDLVISKPDWYCDDKPCEEFMLGRFYYDLK